MRFVDLVQLCLCRVLLALLPLPCIASYVLYHRTKYHKSFPYSARAVAIDARRITYQDMNGWVWD